MAKKRAKFFETRFFGFIIAAAVIAIILALSYGTGILASLEMKVNDLNFRLKLEQRGKTVQEGSVYTEKDPRISDDILIIGIDFNSLTKYGKWPFPRTKHADLVNAFARIKDQTARENALLLDIFFTDPDEDPKADQILSKTIADSGRVFLESELKPDANETSSAQDFAARSAAIEAKQGTITHITGDWHKIDAFFGEEPPLAAYGQAMAGYGHANFLPDSDTIFF